MIAVVLTKWYLKTCYDQQEQKVHVADAAANKLDERYFVCSGRKEHSNLRVMSGKLSFWSLEFNLMSSGREKKIQIGGQMSIAKNTSTTLVNVIRSIACFCQDQNCFSKPWLCWLSRAGPPSTVHSDRIEPVTKKENDTDQVISNRCFLFILISFHYQ